MDCFSCRGNERVGDLPLRERIGVDRYWRVAHASGTALPGWLVLVPRRHVTAVADLTDEEAAGLGRWQVALSRALREVTGCVRTYVAQFAEKQGFTHVHFHVVPRMDDQPADRRGPAVFGYLAEPADRHAPQDVVDALAAALSAHLPQAG